MTRFGKIEKYLIVYGNFVMAYLVFGIIFGILWQFLNAIGLFFIVVLWLNIKQIILLSGHTEQSSEA